MKFRYTILYVADVAATLAFYEAAFGFKTKMNADNAFAELDTGEVSISFCSLALLEQLGKTTMRPDVARAAFEIALETDDVAAAFTHAVAAGAKPLQEPQDMPWGQTTAYVADPDGFWIEICTPVKAQ